MLCLFHCTSMVNWSDEDHLASEAAAQRCSVKQVFLEILENSLENTCARVSFLIKLKEAPAQMFSCEFDRISKRPATFLKKRLWHLCFLASFAKFLRTPFFHRIPPVAASVACNSKWFLGDKNHFEVSCLC